MKRDDLMIKKINGHNVVIRLNADGSEDAQVSEMHARSQGYNSIADMVARNLGMSEIYRLFGRVPACVRIKQPCIL